MIQLEWQRANLEDPKSQRAAVPQSPSRRVQLLVDRDACGYTCRKKKESIMCCSLPIPIYVYVRMCVCVYIYIYANKVCYI